MNNKTLIDNLRCIPDFPKKGINFRDVTTLYKSAECMKIMTDELYELYKDKAGEFRFRLKAGNGEIIGKSEGYKAKASAKKGIASIAKNAPDAAIVVIEPEKQ